jgi:hypothetical protein
LPSNASKRPAAAVGVNRPSVTSRSSPGSCARTSSREELSLETVAQHRPEPRLLLLRRRCASSLLAPSFAVVDDRLPDVVHAARFERGHGEHGRIPVRARVEEPSAARYSAAGTICRADVVAVALVDRQRVGDLDDAF